MSTLLLTLVLVKLTTTREETIPMQISRLKAVATVAMMASVALILSGCAGSAGGGGSNSERGGGYEFGAPQEEIDEVIEGLDPVTINYQIPATSMNSPQAPIGTEFKEAIEERSNGKITVELAWTESIAPWTELHDALADGRVDIAFTVPSYEPARFPAFTAFNELLGGYPSPPMTGDLLTNLLAAEVSWQTPEILEEFEAIGATPLIPVMGSASYVSLCTDPVPKLEDWQGLQVRVGSPAANDMVADVGGSPVSLAGTEAYEALQRGTIDCTLPTPSDAIQHGLLEIAPHVGFTTTTSFPRVATALLTGSTVEELPLAYQQIIFDSLGSYFHGDMTAGIGSKDDLVSEAKKQGGKIEEASPELQSEIQSFANAKRQEIVDSGILGEDILERMDESRQVWAEQIEEFGYIDEGTLEDFDQWYDSETDYRPIANELLERSMLKFRPN